MFKTVSRVIGPGGYTLFERIAPALNRKDRRTRRKERTQAERAEWSIDKTRRHHASESVNSPQRNKDATTRRFSNL